jgi:hypothetical protein
MLGLLLVLSLQNPPDLEKLAAAGQATRQRIAAGQASWTAFITLENGLVVEAHVATQGDRESTVLRANGQDLGRLIVRDGIWYVSDPLGARKHRPYEAAFFIPTWYLYRQLAQPQFVTDPAALRDGTFVGIDGDVGTWRTPLPELVRNQLRATLEQFRVAKIDRPDVVRNLQDLVEKGIVCRIHLTTGLIQETQNAKFRIRLADLLLPSKPDPRFFDVPERDWLDFTDDPLKGPLDDLLMIAHTPVWQKGQKAGDMNLGLIHAVSGRFRRIPYQGGVAGSGCFSRDRRKVYVTGTTLEGFMGLFEVDLATGANRRLAGNLAAEGMIMMPALSPDGRTLAALHGGGQRRLLENDITLVDLETGNGKYIGETADRAFFSWLPDGKGLILLERQRVTAGEPQPHWICRMDLEGRVTRIREGDHPLLLGDGRTLLFNQRQENTWATCDLEGKNERPFGDGRRHYSFATPAPDGKRLLMMRFRPEAGPEPVIIDLATGQERVIPHDPGLWGHPAWR